MASLGIHLEQDKTDQWVKQLEHSQKAWLEIGRDYTILRLQLSSNSNNKRIIIVGLADELYSVSGIFINVVAQTCSDSYPFFIGASQFRSELLQLNLC